MAIVHETTDAPSSAATPYHLAAGDVFFGTLPQNGSDWVAVTLVAGRSYAFGAVGMGVTDPYLKLYAPGGAVVAQDDDGGPGFSARISYVPTVSGTYHLEARALAGEPEGLRLAGRYARIAGEPANEDIPALAEGRGDRHVSLYAGVTWFAHHPNLRVMAGIEWERMERSDRGQVVYEGITPWLAARIFF